MPDSVAQPQRRIVTIQSHLQPLAVSGDPCAWLAEHARPGMVLLAHADDGVIWGVAAATGVLRFPAAAVLAQPPFRPATLLMARLFDAERETFLWRVEEGRWAARQIADGAGADIDCIDEQQLLWGTRAEESDGAFTRVVEGSQGLLHAFPRALAPNALSDAHRLRLGVRHYLTEDAAGWRRIAYSRLTGVSA
jgi:CRISPR-associated protein (TIGR03984 family)